VRFSTAVKTLQQEDFVKDVLHIPFFARGKIKLLHKIYNKRSKNLKNQRLLKKY
jgi:hypothetical protein